MAGKCEGLLGFYRPWNIGHGRYAEGDAFTTAYEAWCSVGFNEAMWEVREVRLPEGEGANG